MSNDPGPPSLVERYRSHLETAAVWAWVGWGFVFGFLLGVAFGAGVVAGIVLCLSWAFKR